MAVVLLRRIYDIEGWTLQETPLSYQKQVGHKMSILKIVIYMVYCDVQ